MISREKQLDLFFNNVEDASTCFNIDSDGNLNTLVNTGLHFDKYDLEVIFHNSFVQIITQIEDPDLILYNNETYQSMQNLLDSLNSINRNGQFYIDKKSHAISFMSLCYLEDIIKADNPWMVIFSGIETINHFAETIQSVFNGSQIFYIKQIG